MRVFQSTHPGGVRPTGGKCSRQAALHFNPRTRVGCDIPNSTGTVFQFLFQSTHPGGVRHNSYSDMEQELKKFQSTHPGGVRPKTVNLP